MKCPISYSYGIHNTEGPCTQQLGTWALGIIVIIIRALGKYMIIGYLDP